MKLLKKNQVIIYVIAIMLMTAGYLNYTTNQEGRSVQTSMQMEASDDMQLAEVGDARLVNSDDIVGGDTTETNTVNMTDNQTAQTTTDDRTENTISQTAQTSSDTNKEDYFVKSKLERDTMYSQMIETYEKVLNSNHSLETQKQSATEEITKINEIKNSIMICENLIQTKGFQNSIIFVNGESISIIVGVQEIYILQQNNRRRGFPLLYAILLVMSRIYSPISSSVNSNSIIKFLRTSLLGKSSSLSILTYCRKLIPRSLDIFSCVYFLDILFSLIISSP